MKLTSGGAKSLKWRTAVSVQRRHAGFFPYPLELKITPRTKHTGRNQMEQIKVHINNINGKRRLVTMANTKN